MFAVLFEVHPGPDQWEAYLGNAKMLRPELEQIDGFVDNIRYRSLPVTDGCSHCRAGETRRRSSAGGLEPDITRSRRRDKRRSSWTTASG